VDVESSLSSLLEDPDFLRIDASRRRFNLFDAIGAQRAELRHSNFLSFLLSPEQNHGLGVRLLRPLLRCVLEKMPNKERPVSSLQIAIADLEETTIFRELEYVDILIVVRELKFVILIENKVGSKESRGQLERYKTFVKRKYSDWHKVFVFLTPTGENASDSEYLSLSYSELAKLIDDIRGKNAETILGPEIKLILDHYTQMLRRHIVDDSELKDIAIRIYQKHSDALDFIFKNKPQGTSLLPIAQSLAKAQDGLTEDRHTESMFRFAPTQWSQFPVLNSCPQSSWTKTGRNVLFEIKSFKYDGEYYDRLLLSLILGPSETNLRHSIFDAIHSRKAVFRNASKSIGQSWVTVFSCELLNEAEAENMDDAEKRSRIEENWNTFKSENLPRLTSAMIEIATEVAAHGSP